MIENRAGNRPTKLPKNDPEICATLPLAKYTHKVYNEYRK